MIQVNSGLMPNAGYYANINKAAASVPQFVPIEKEAPLEEEQGETKVDFYENSLGLVGPNAPQCVKDAWMECAEEVGIDGRGTTKSGGLYPSPMSTKEHFYQYWWIHLMGVRGRLFALAYGNGLINPVNPSNPYDLLGDNIGTAIKATKDALYDLDHPLDSPACQSAEDRKITTQLREFYVKFLDKLEQML